jgi:hypothetical protein
MGDGFSVDLDALGTAAAGIIDVLIELDSHKVEDIDCESNAFGHSKLAGTTKDFCDRWQRGVANLAEDGAQIADRLVKSLQTYQDMEDRTARQLEDIEAGRMAEPCTDPEGE